MKTQFFDNRDKEHQGNLRCKSDSYIGEFRYRQNNKIINCSEFTRIIKYIFKLMSSLQINVYLPITVHIVYLLIFYIILFTILKNSIVYIYYKLYLTHNYIHRMNGKK